MATPRPPASETFHFRETSSIVSLIDKAMTFDNWERKHEFKIAEFLTLDFYYVITGIRCSRCLLIQSEWNPSRPLIVQHCEFNSNCPLVLEFFDNPLVNYYFQDSDLMQAIHTTLVKARINSFQ
jgi:hypothetical protein